MLAFQNKFVGEKERQNYQDDFREQVVVSLDEYATDIHGLHLNIPGHLPMIGRVSYNASGATAHAPIRWVSPAERSIRSALHQLHLGTPGLEVAQKTPWNLRWIRGSHKFKA